VLFSIKGEHFERLPSSLYISAVKTTWTNAAWADPQGGNYKLEATILCSASAVTVAGEFENRCRRIARACRKVMYYLLSTGASEENITQRMIAVTVRRRHGITIKIWLGYTVPAKRLIGKAA